MGYIGSGPTRFNTADELTVTGDAEFNGNLTVKGTTTTIDSASVQTVDLGDNDKIRLGDGDDLQIYHDGSNSYIQDVGTGNLIIEGANVVIDGANGNRLASFVSGGRAELQYDGAEKLRTTSTGVDVTGTVTADGVLNNNKSEFFASESALVSTGSTAKVYATNSTFDGVNGSLVLQSRPTSGADVYIATGTTPKKVAKFDDGGDISFYDSTGVTQGFFWDASTQRLGLGTSSPSGTLDILAPATTEPLRIKATTDVYNYITHKNAAGTDVAYTGLGGGAAVTTGAVTDYAIRATANLLFGAGANTERMRIDSSGNVGIGTTSPSALLHLDGTTPSIFLQPSADTEVAAIRFRNAADSNTQGMIEYNHSENSMSFRTNGVSDRLFIDSSGNLLVGTTSTFAGSGITPILTVQKSNGSAIGATGIGSAEVGIATRPSANHNYYAGFFLNSSGTGVGNIQVTPTSTAYNTSSDYRLKTAVTYDWDATTRLKQLRPARFEWISDGDDAVPVDGFLAHEVQDVVPEAVTGTKDAMRDEEYEVSAATGDIYTPAIEAVLDEDGVEVTPAVAEVIHSTDVERPEELAEGQQWRETTAAVIGTRSVPDYQGIDQSKLVPLLVKTIQELEARITALETA
jgi:hypothetical protein